MGYEEKKKLTISHTQTREFLQKVGEKKLSNGHGKKNREFIKLSCKKFFIFESSLMQFL